MCIERISIGTVKEFARYAGGGREEQGLNILASGVGFNQFGTSMGLQIELPTL